MYIYVCMFLVLCTVLLSVMIFGVVLWYALKQVFNYCFLCYLVVHVLIGFIIFSLSLLLTMQLFFGGLCHYIVNCLL